MPIKPPEINLRHPDQLRRDLMSATRRAINGWSTGLVAALTKVFMETERPRQNKEQGPAKMSPGPFKAVFGETLLAVILNPMQNPALFKSLIDTPLSVHADHPHTDALSPPMVLALMLTSTGPDMDKNLKDAAALTSLILDDVFDPDVLGAALRLGLVTQVVSWKSCGSACRSASDLDDFSHAEIMDSPLFGSADALAALLASALIRLRTDAEAGRLANADKAPQLVSAILSEYHIHLVESVSTCALYSSDFNPSSRSDWPDTDSGIQLLDRLLVRLQENRETGPCADLHRPTPPSTRKPALRK